MRDLTKQQKKFLLNWANANPDKMNGHQPVDNIEKEDWKTLEEINNTEVLYQNCNRFLNDLERETDPITFKTIYKLP